MASIKMDIFMKSRTTFQVVATTLLSLLLPLSFLLLSRLSTALAPPNDESSAAVVFFSFLLDSVPFSPLHLLVSLLCIASLAHAVNDGWTIMASRPSLHTAWILLCTLQLCVGLGIEGSIGAGVVKESRDGLMCGRKIVFFLGLYATTVCWWRMVVKPVVDDTMFGGEVEERWVERVVMGAALGGLWWWRLRDEVEALTQAADFMGWWLYYLVVTIGMVRAVKGLIWFGVILLCRKVEVEDDINGSRRVEEKV